MKIVKQVCKYLLLTATLSVLVSCMSNNGADDYKAPLTSNDANNYNGGVIQVYAARTHGAKQALAVHTWVSVKKSNESQFTSYEIIGWKLRYQDTALAIRNSEPNRDWWGHSPELILDYRKPDADRVIDKIVQAVERYPHKDEYQVWPGPNSNTFTAYVGLQVPELGLDLPSTAIGKDYRSLDGLVGLSPSGSGVQASIFGLLGLTVGIEEGLELNILGLSFELDLFDLAMELPGVGRIGAAPAVIETPQADQLYKRSIFTFSTLRY